MCRRFSFFVSFVLVLCLFGNAWGLEIGGLEWGTKNIGNPGIPGSASYEAGTDTLTISGSGHDIWGGADGFYFVYRPLLGNGTLDVNLISMDNTSGWAKVGPAIRKTLDAGSMHGMTAMTVANGIQYVWRLSPGGGSAGVARPGTPPLPIQIKVVDNLVTSSYWYQWMPGMPFSWTMIGTPQTILMDSDAYIGIVVCATNNGALNTAVLKSLSLTAPPVEFPWAMSPEDGAARMPLTPTLSWIGGDSATSQEVWMGTDPAALALVDTVTEGSYTPATPLTGGTVYHWQIVDLPSGVAGPPMSFKTER